MNKIRVMKQTEPHTWAAALGTTGYMIAVRRLSKTGKLTIDADTYESRERRVRMGNMLTAHRPTNDGGLIDVSEDDVRQFAHALLDMVGDTVPVPKPHPAEEELAALRAELRRIGTQVRSVRTEHQSALDQFCAIAVSGAPATSRVRPTALS